MRAASQLREPSANEAQGLTVTHRTTIMATPAVVSKKRGRTPAPGPPAHDSVSERLDALERLLHGGSGDAEQAQQMLQAIKMEAATNNEGVAAKTMGHYRNRLWNLAVWHRQGSGDAASVLECKLRAAAITVRRRSRSCQLPAPSSPKMVMLPPSQWQLELVYATHAGFDDLMGLVADGCAAWLRLGDVNEAIECYKQHEGALVLHGAENVDDLPQYLNIVLCKAKLLRASGEPAEYQ